MTRMNGNTSGPVKLDPTYPSDAYSPDVRLTAPRRVRNGVKLRGKGPAPVFGPMVQGWVEESLAGVREGTAREGLEYARWGQAVEVVLGAGRITARVQGRAVLAYEVALEFATWAQEKWEALLGVIASDAGATADVLGGGLPANFSDVLSVQGERMLPAIGEMGVHCGCGGEQACKHVVAVTYLVADRLSEHPAAVMGLRGMESSEVVERVRVLRARLHAPQQGGGLGRGLSGEGGAAALEACVETFWRGTGLGALRSAGPLHHPPYALLHRLGPSPLGGKFPLVGLLASIYDTAAKHAGGLRERRAGESEEEAAEG